MPNLFPAIIHWVTVKKDRCFKAANAGLILNLVKAGNCYFRKAFAATPFERRLLFLPFCLRPLTCPAFLDNDQGYTCPELCPECEMGQVRQEALALGYAGVYVVHSSRIIRRAGLAPSDQFMLDKVRRHRPRAVLGVVCQWYVYHRLITKYTIGRKGYQDDPGRSAAVVQGVLLKDMNCRKASVDWGQVRERLYLKEK
jgi:hypothetical protein